ncbi:MAG: Carbon monoxide dehydrogenase CooS, partial [bacterium 42_11]
MKEHVRFKVASKGVSATENVEELLEKAEREGIETAWHRFIEQQPQCGFGLLGICCRNCAMGPCR